ncbi:MAG TPA: hypothetical protein VGQ57_16280 [Polyangiaceae bacterium]|nr:hypothetical protein [Polyangiaceae bacterium]
MVGKKTLCLLGLALGCGRSTSGTGPGTGDDAAGQGGGTASAGTATIAGSGVGLGGAGAGGAFPSGSGGWGNYANAAGWIPFGDLDPIPGAHDVVEAECDGERIGPEYLVQPNILCINPFTPDSSPFSPTRDTTRILCGVAAYCMNQSDCTAQPFGRCEGFASVGCHYPTEPCLTDADCTSELGGRCPHYTEQFICESSDRCYPVVPKCAYPPQAIVCETDADCSERPGGQCHKSILYPRCTYDGCARDADCGSGRRCGCSNDQNRCVPADCTTDADCGVGQTCLPQNGCLALDGFHCTTPNDGCRSGDDCSSARCEWAGTSWQCVAAGCPLD